MAKKGNRTWTWMEPEDKKVPGIRLQTERNKVNQKEKLRVKMYHPVIRQHVWFKETKASK